MEKIALKLFGIAVIPFFIGGCAELSLPSLSPHKSSYYKSVIEAYLNEESEQIIVSDFLKIIKKYYPPAKTTFYISPVLSIQNRSFTDVFETKFRKAGYAIASQSNNAISLAWKIDFINNNLIRTTFILDGVTISKLYRLSGGNIYSYTTYTIQLGGR